MADVFISYSRHDRDVAKRLADDLRARDIDVWWDVELYAGARFHDDIRMQLAIATAVIVVWSTQAVQSIWVVGEAQLAANAGKLISTLAPDFPVEQLPRNHSEIHAVPVEDRTEILKALERIGVAPAGTTVQGLDRQLLDFARSSRHRSAGQRKAFICYALDDRRLVQSALCAYETGGELTVFLEVKRPASDASEDAYTRAQLNAADVFVLFWSKYAAHSDVVHREVGALLTHVEHQRAAGMAPTEVRIVTLERNAPPLPEALLAIVQAQGKA
jgi:hypothetical protein